MADSSDHFRSTDRTRSFAPASSPGEVRQPEQSPGPGAAGSAGEVAVRAVVFDMDGLMFNTEQIYSLAGTELMRRRGLDFPDGLKNAMMGLPPQPAFEQMIRWHGLSESWEALSAESDEIFLGLLDGRLSPMPGLVELLEALEAAGLPKAIATSSRRRLTEACLRPFDLIRRFEFVLTSEDVTRGKPDPEIYQTAAQRLGLRPQEIAVLEDSENGCRAAVAAGALAIAVPGPHSQTHDFESAALVAENLADPRLYTALGLAPRGASDQSADGGQGG